MLDHACYYRGGCLITRAIIISCLPEGAQRVKHPFLERVVLVGGRRAAVRVERRLAVPQEDAERSATLVGSFEGNIGLFYG